MTGLLDRLTARELPTETVRFPADQAAWDRALVELEEAEAALLEAQRRGAPTPDLESVRDRARAVVDEMPRTVFVVRALPPKQWEDLAAEHQPADKNSTLAWEPTFYPPLLATTVTSDGESMTEQEWAVLFASKNGLTTGEKNTLINTAIALNTRPSVVSDSVGKASAPTQR